MKKHLSVLIAVLMIFSVALVSISAAEENAWKIEYNGYNEAQPYNNESIGIFDASFEGDNSTASAIHTTDAKLRYKYLISFEPVEGTDYYKAAKAGNNLVDTWVENSAEIPEGGFLLAFYYNGDESIYGSNEEGTQAPTVNNTACKAIYDLICPEGTNNAMVAVSSDAYAVLDSTNKKLSVSVSEPGDDNSGEESSTASEEESSEAASAVESSEGGTAPTGNAGYTAIAVIALISLAGAVIVKKSR